MKLIDFLRILSILDGMSKSILVIILIILSIYGIKAIKIYINKNK